MTEKVKARIEDIHTNPVDFAVLAVMAGEVDVLAGPESGL